MLSYIFLFISGGYTLWLMGYRSAGEHFVCWPDDVLQYLRGHSLQWHVSLQVCNLIWSPFLFLQPKNIFHLHKTKRQFSIIWLKNISASSLKSSVANTFFLSIKLLNQELFIFDLIFVSCRSVSPGKSFSSTSSRMYLGYEVN